MQTVLRHMLVAGTCQTTNWSLFQLISSGVWIIWRKCECLKSMQSASMVQKQLLCQHARPHFGCCMAEGYSFDIDSIQHVLDWFLLTTVQWIGWKSARLPATRNLPKPRETGWHVSLHVSIWNVKAFLVLPKLVAWKFFLFLANSWCLLYM